MRNALRVALLVFMVTAFQTPSVVAQTSEVPLSTPVPTPLPEEGAGLNAPLSPAVTPSSAEWRNEKVHVAAGAVNISVPRKCVPVVSEALQLQRSVPTNDRECAARIKRALEVQQANPMPEPSNTVEP